MKYESNQTYLWVLLYIKTHCVILTAIYQNIGHMNWLPVRGNKCFICTDLLALSCVLQVATREGSFVRGTR